MRIAATDSYENWLKICPASQFSSLSYGAIDFDICWSVHDGDDAVCAANSG